MTAPTLHPYRITVAGLEYIAKLTGQGGAHGA